MAKLGVQVRIVCADVPESVQCLQWNGAYIKTGCKRKQITICDTNCSTPQRQQHIAKVPQHQLRISASLFGQFTLQAA